MVFRRTNSLRPIHSVKHIIDNQGGVAAGIKTVINIATAVDNPVLANRTEVDKGSKVNSLFLNVQVVPSGAATFHNAYFIIYKNPQGHIPAADISKANQTGVNEFKRQIFHTEMAMLGDDGDSIPITLFKGVLKVPKIFRTMRMDDEISLQLYTDSGTFDFCVQCIYKEYQ